MNDLIEVIYYQMLELENRLDKKIEYLEKAEKTIEAGVLEMQRLLKEVKELKNGN